MVCVWYLLVEFYIFFCFVTISNFELWKIGFENLKIESCFFVFLISWITSKTTHGLWTEATLYYVLYLLYNSVLHLTICVSIMCRNDELSSMMSWVGCLLKDSELFILFAENSQILLKISVIPILLTFIYLVALNLLVNNQLNSSSNSTHHCGT